MMCLAGGVAYSAPSITGYVDGSYNYNLAPNAKSATVAGTFVPANQYNAYEGQTRTFNLNDAHLSISNSDSATGVGYDIETDFGSDAAVNEPNNGASKLGSLFDVQQAFLTYAFGPGRAWGLKAGKYDTYEGIEVTASGSNPTISRGLLFTLAEPISHTGFELNYTQGMVDAHIGLVNGWDQVTDLNTTPTLLGKVGLNWGDPLALSISGLYGEEATPAGGRGMVTSLDLTGVTHSVKMVDINFQGNYGMQEHASALSAGKTGTWFGAGLQPLVHISSMYGVGLRYEYFDDLDGVKTGQKQALNDISVVPTVWVNKYLTVRAEYRVDISNKNDFFKDGATLAGPTAKNQQIISGDLIATF